MTGKFIKRNLVVGVTGGIGSGKTCFVEAVGRCGARILDVDSIAKELVENKSEIRRAINRAFGDEFFHDDGALNRRKLGQLVFSNRESLYELNRIIQPQLISELKERIEDFKNQADHWLLVVDMAILFEAGVESFFNVIVVISAPLQKRIEWLKNKRAWTRKEILDRMEAQLDVKEKMNKADVVIENSGSLEALNALAMDFYKRLQLSIR